MLSLSKEPWHRGTRYWKLAGEVIFLSFVLFAIVIFREPDYISNAFTYLTIIIPVIFGGAAAVKHQEKKNNGN